MATISMSGIAFIASIGLEAFTIAALGLIIGGLLAAPVGASLAKRFPAKKLLFMVGTVLTATSLFSLYKAIS